MKKIDAHSHIGTFGGWAGFSFDSQQLIAQMKEYEIEKTILCASNSHNNEEVKEAFVQYPDQILPLVYVNPKEGQKAVDTIYHYVKECGFVGIKMQPLSDAFVADDACVDPVMEAAQKLHIPVFIHCGHPPYSLPWSIALLAERHPKVKTVMIHMGHGHGVYIDASIKMALRYPNLYLEMSGMPMSVKIKEAYDKVGSDRVMFGIDAPFHHPTVEIQKILTSGLGEKEQENVFYKNAAKLMGLL